MPINLSTNKVKFKDSNGNYVSIDAMTDQGTTSRIAAIEATKTTAVNAVNAAKINAITDIEEEKRNYFKDISVGTAEQLISTQFETDNVPYNLRNSGGGNVSVGNRINDTIVGGTIAWNQLVGDNTTTVTIPNGHIYIAYISGNWSCGESVGSAISVTGGEDMMFDITLMFGSDIATYINGFEASGVTWFRNLFPNSYYTYNNGVLISVNVAAHIMRDASENIICNCLLDNTLTLYGLPKITNGKLYYDGDTYESNGLVTRKYGIVDLGTLNWSKRENNDHLFYSDSSINEKRKTGISMICAKYNVIENISSISGLNDKPDKSICGLISSSSSLADKIYLKDTSYDNAATLKTALSGVYLVYELNTATSSIAETYTNPQIIDKFGTEEYVDYAYSQNTRDVAMPVGHITEYMIDLRKKIENLPEIPVAPTTNGIYLLKATVLNGEVTYEWQSE